VHAKSKSHYDRRPVGQCVLVSSPIWGSWPDINYSKSKSLYDRRSIGQSVLVSSLIWVSWLDINLCLTFTLFYQSHFMIDWSSVVKFFAASKHNYDVHVTTNIHKDVAAGQRVRVYEVINWHRTTKTRGWRNTLIHMGPFTIFFWGGDSFLTGAVRKFAYRRTFNLCALKHCTLTIFNEWMYILQQRKFNFWRFEDKFKIKHSLQDDYAESIFVC
jgi:hypothetical protein